MPLFLLQELNEASAEHQAGQNLIKRKYFMFFGVKERIFSYGLSPILNGEYFLLFAKLKYSDMPLFQIISNTTF